MTCSDRRHGGHSIHARIMPPRQRFVKAEQPPASWHVAACLVSYCRRSYNLADCDEMEGYQMLRALLVTVPTVLFLIVLFGGGAVFRRKNIDMDGKAPIGQVLFYSSKYLIVLVWGAAVADAWGLRWSALQLPTPVRQVGLALWILGFLLLLTGRLGMGNSFRIGSAQESTALKTGGLFAISRNPMYLGVYSTLLGATLYTLNPAVLLISVYIIAVHHKIVLAEEEHLKGVFGSEYADYCRRVRRYI